jgi:hypothetical protein
MGDWPDDDPGVALHAEPDLVSDREPELDVLVEVLPDVAVPMWRAAMPPPRPRNIAALSRPAATRDLLAAGRRRAGRLVPSIQAPSSWHRSVSTQPGPCRWSEARRHLGVG